MLTQRRYRFGRSAALSAGLRRLRGWQSFEPLEPRWALAATPAPLIALTADQTADVNEPQAAAAAYPAPLSVLPAELNQRNVARRLTGIAVADEAAPARRAVKRAAAAAAAIVAPFAEPAAAPTAPVGDFSGDGKVDRTDAAILARNFGRAADAVFTDGDLNEDGAVSLADLAMLRFGPGAFDITAPVGTSDDDTPDVAWTASPGAVRYDIVLEDVAGCGGESIVQSATDIDATAYTFDALSDGTYYVCVRAFDELGNATDAANNGHEFTIAAAPAGSISIEHTASVDRVSTAGTVVNYTYTVQNTGDVPLSGVTVEDSRSLVLVRGADSPGDGDDLLEAGETWRYTASYVVAAADLSAGLDLVSIATADSDQSQPATHEAVVFNLFELAEITVAGVRVVPIDHASFVMLWGNVTVYVDPVGGGALYTGLPRADLILITHSHGDHYHPTTINAVSDAETQFITSQTVYNLSTYSTYRDRTTILGYGQSASLLGLSVEAVHAYNGNHSLGTGNGYIVTIDGLRVYISGDTGAVPEIRVLEAIDVAFLCMNVPFTMTVDEAAGVVRDMRPAMVIPYHYRNQNGTFAELARFKSLVGRDLGIEVRLLDWY